jgi:hypothetical protein
MIYMVACRFTGTDEIDKEAQWNAYYDGPKLDALLSLDGFTSSQRFKCVHASPAPYVALHTIRDLAVMDDRYRSVGGGGFGGWEPWIDNWSRNLFDGLEVSPDVPIDSFLAITDDEATATALTGIDFAWIDCVGLDRSVTRRALAVLDPSDGEELASFRPAGLSLYRPIIKQQHSS